MSHDSSAHAPGRKSLVSYVHDLSRFGGREACRWREGVRWRVRTYEQMHRRILACAALLREAELPRGGHVLIEGPDGPDWIEALLGTICAAGVAVPLETGSTDAFRASVAAASGARHVIAAGQIAAPAGVRRIVMGSWGEAGPGSVAIADPHPTDRAEVIFTSGTTARPKGVVLTHANIISDLAPIERGVAKRERLLGWFAMTGPLRMLSTLPLSHMFGQVMNVLLPFSMGLTVIFVPPRPADIMEAARRWKTWGLFTVPRVLELLSMEARRSLKEKGALASFERRQERLATRPWYLQAIAFRGMRRLLGWRFRFFVVGGAALAEPVQKFWERSGYLVVQGYGLTETAPIVSLSNPFDRRHHTVGRPLSAMEVKLSPDGEVLVRGPNVMQGYLDSGEETTEIGGWLHTGDVGSFDAQGRLTIRGRIKDIIVTPEGENVHAVDVEEAFRGLPGVRDVSIIGLPTERGEQVHAILLMAPRGDSAAAVRAANEKLMTKQRVRGHTVWPDADFPRSGVGKVRKGILRERIAAITGETNAGAANGGARLDARRLVAQAARVRPETLEDTTRLEKDLGLKSLDLVELSLSLEEEYGLRVPEGWLADATVGALEALVSFALAPIPGATAPPPGDAPSDAAALGKSATSPTEMPGGASSETVASASAYPLPLPRWAKRFVPHALRRVAEELLYVPVVRLFARPRVEGLHHLRGLELPVLFVANHRSHIDGGLFKTMLPRRIRGRIAAGMTARHHRTYFSGAKASAFRRGLEWVQVRIVQLLFHAWPIPEAGGLRESLSYAGELADAGYSLLIFPEGRHIAEGHIEAFKSGIGMFARALRMPVVPVYLEGTARVLPAGAWLPRFGRTRMVLGAPLWIDPEADAADATQRIERAVRDLAGPDSVPPTPFRGASPPEWPQIP